MRFWKSRGVTVIEIIAVLAVMAILTSVAVVRVADTGASTAGETELLKANLRFAQARAMSEGLQAVWGVEISSGSYRLIRDGVQAPLHFPGEDASAHVLNGAAVSGGTGRLTFDFFGRPSLDGSLLRNDHVIAFSGGKTVTVVAHTGFIP
jgi:prepilin-type N-terminal cleavage/methylation domain-containing protein